jgi:hypothetical protein
MNTVPLNIFLVEAESRNVPGRLLEAFYERKKALEFIRSLKHQFGKELAYADITTLTPE